MNTVVYGTAGTGKTTWLINHALQSIEQGYRVGILSFSTTAIQEIKERLILAGAPKFVFDDIRTIHSFAYIHTIGRERIGYALDRVPYRFLRFMHIPFSRDAFDTSKEGNSWLAAITFAINRAMTKDGDEILKELQLYQARFGLLKLNAMNAYALFRKYENWKKEHGLLDFNDILLEFYEKVRRYGSVASYDIIYIDEAQDLSPLAMNIILSAFEAEQIYFVGDPLQNIYESLLGTSMNLFLEVGEEEILLERGYRVPQNIFDLALSCAGAPPKLHQLYSRTKHVDVNGAIIEREALTLPELVKFVRMFKDKNIAILLPKNRQVLLLAEELIKHGIIPTAYKASSPVGNMVDIVNALISLREGGKVDFKAVKERLIKLGIKEDDPHLEILESPLYDQKMKTEVLLRYARRLGFILEDITQDKVLHVVIDTIHSSKGREADVVILPYYNRLGVRDRQLARRLFFVGSTRTKNVLILVRNIIVPRKGGII